MDELAVIKDLLNQGLTLMDLSREALAVGIGVGFNCAEVVHFIDTETMEDLLEFTWGDRNDLCRPRFRTPQSWALSYSDEVDCTRAPRKLMLPRSVASESSDQLKARFTEALLELADG